MLDSDLLGTDNRGMVASQDRVAADAANVMRSFGNTARSVLQSLRTSDDVERAKMSAHSGGLIGIRRRRHAS
jgi:hypothetical protein